MNNFSVELYKSDYKELWDTFVSKAIIDSFLFYRDFMEYHKDRFDDYSLLIFNERDLIAILPANRIENVVYSHQGLTFGGLIVNETLEENDFKAIFKTIISFLKLNTINDFIIKSLPKIYWKKDHTLLDELFFNDFKVIQTNMVLTIDYSKPIKIHKTKLKNYRKSDKYNFEIRETNNFEAFWKQVLEPRLLDKHNAKPVHTLSEIKYLSNKFPENIKQFDIYINDEILAGITIFESDSIVKSQYGATTIEGQKVRALDFLFLQLIEKYKLERKSYFSMGTVMDANFTEGYNPGLLKQKQELGCEIFHQDIYSIQIQ